MAPTQDSSEPPRVASGAPGRLSQSQQYVYVTEHDASVFEGWGSLMRNVGPIGRSVGKESDGVTTIAL